MFSLYLQTKRAKTSGEPVYLYSVQDDSPRKRLSCIGFWDKTKTKTKTRFF